MTLNELDEKGIKFSLQKRITDNQMHEIGLQAVIDYILIDEDVLQLTQQLRHEMLQLNLKNREDKSKYQKLKSNLLQCFTPGGTFTTPKKEHLTSYSHIVQIDFDDIDENGLNLLDEFIRSERSVVFSFVSPGGSGKKIFHLVSSDQEGQDINQLQKFHTMAFWRLYELYEARGLTAGFDKNVHDLSRRCYLAHDTCCFVNEDIQPLKIQYNFQPEITATDTETEKRKETLLSLYNHNARPYENINPDKVIDDLDKLLAWLTDNNKSITDSYYRWFRVIVALKKELPPTTARAYAMAFSRLDANFNENDFNKQYDSESDDNKAPGLGTIFYFAKEEGWPMPKRSTTYIKRFFLIQQLVKHGIHVRRNKLIDIFEISYNGGRWERYTDDDDSRLRAGVLEYYFTREDIKDELCLISETYDPAKEFIKSIPVWDGVDRLEELLLTLNPAEPHLPRKFLEYWMIGMLAGISSEEKYNEHVLILQGDQGDGKTRWVRRLFEEILTFANLRPDRYFINKAINPDNKDDIKLLCQSFVVFYDELAGLVESKSDITSFKNVTSMKSTTLRKAYDRHETQFVRTASIIATVNDPHFLKDTTGNRRFWIIPCRNTNQYHQINIVQLWAQIKHYYLEGRRYWFEKNELNELNEYNRSFESYSLEEELILTYVHVSDDNRMSTAEIIREIEKHEVKPIKCTPAYFGKLMTKHFGKRSKRTNKGTVYSVTVEKETIAPAANPFYGEFFERPNQVLTVTG